MNPVIDHMNWYLKSNHIVLAKDAPLNIRGWLRKWGQFYKWATSVLSSAEDGDVHSAMIEFSRILLKTENEDRHRIGQTEYGYMWEEPDWFFRNIRDYKGSLESADFYISDSQAKKALGSMKYMGEYVEKIEFHRIGFKEARDACYQTLTEYVGDEDSSLTPADVQSLLRSSRVVAKWFKDFTNIEKARKSVVEDIETLVEWGGNKGPEDRSSIDKLYHTTIAAGEIEQNGFRINTESRGLGGSTDDMISTTLSKNVAVGIADALKKIIPLANGTANFSTIIKWSKKGGVWDEIIEAGKTGLSGVAMFIRVSGEVGEDKTIEMLDNGYVPVFPYGLDKPTVDELPDGAVVIKNDKIGSKEVVSAYWEKNTSRHDDLLMSMFRAYLSYIESSGKGYDPLFFGVDLGNFRGLDVQNIGIFELEADMEDPEIKYVPGMYEYRVPVESIKSVKRIA